jgi:hypothetical protein
VERQPRDGTELWAAAEAGLAESGQAFVEALVLVAQQAKMAWLFEADQLVSACIVSPISKHRGLVELVEWSLELAVNWPL